MRRLFVFRPEPGAATTVRQARALGLDAVAIPLFALQPLDWSAPDPGEFDALLLTSASAVRMAGDQLDRLRGLPVHAVGQATAVAAEVAGLGIASVGTGGIDQLLGQIEPGARLLHLCGEHRRAPQSAAQAIRAVPVYRATAVQQVAPLDQLCGQVALVHSPRAAARLAELVPPQARASIRVVAISAAAAQACGAGWEQVEAAASPDDGALLALAARLCDKQAQ